ncbi:putative methylesterase 14, chloroplastic, partial [Mucuna pruriens]
MEESCALCEKRATMLCDSDQAKLCWDCDEKVHSANFLVAKHSRDLLCRLCQSPTPWKASGAKLTPTFSFCHRCVEAPRAALVNTHQQHRGFVEDHGEHQSDHDFHDGDNSDDEEEDDEAQNQVVPMSSASATSPPSGTNLALKRLRNNSFSVDSRDETAGSSSEMLREKNCSNSETLSCMCSRWKSWSTFPKVTVSRLVQKASSYYGGVSLSVSRGFSSALDYHALSPDVQEKLVRESPPEGVFNTKYSDHFPFFSRPQSLQSFGENTSNSINNGQHTGSKGDQAGPWPMLVVSIALGKGFSVRFLQTYVTIYGLGPANARPLNF